MMSDAIELKDGNYDLLSAVRKPRQIKTRPSSFSAIKNAWTRFRLARLNRKLDKMENAILNQEFRTDSSSKLSDKTKRQIEKKTAAIARVEEKILILSREDVPKDYVSKRAIKLKKSMMDNLTYNSGNAYSVGADKKEEIFGSNLVENMNSEEPDVALGVTPTENEEERVQEVPGTTVEDILASNEISLADSVRDIMGREASEEAPKTDEVDVTSPELDRQQIKKVIDEEFDKVVGTKGTIAISPEEVEQVVNGTSDEQESEITSEPEETVDQGSVITSEEETIDQESIVSALEDAFKGLDAQNVESQEAIASSDIDSVVSSELDNIGEEEVTDSRVEETVPENEEVVESVDLAVPGNMELPENTDSIVPENDDAISRDDIRKALEEALEQVHISQNGSQIARIDRYDENGEEKGHSDVVKPRERYTYKPMTDEEIRQAQENIEYDKYEEIYHNRTPKTETEQFNPPANIFDVPNFADIFKPVNDSLDTAEEVAVEESQVRDFPAIVPERGLTLYHEKETEVSQDDDIEEYTMREEEQNQEEDLHFDYSETTPGDLKMAFDSVSTLSEVEALKKRARELQEKQRRTKEQMEAAQREAEAAAERAAAAREAARRSFEEYQKRVEKLRMYTEAVQEDCQFNVNKTRMAKEAAEGDERFAEEQQRRAQQNAQLSEEIDAIISPEAINVRRR